MFHAEDGKIIHSEARGSKHSPNFICSLFRQGYYSDYYLSQMGLFELWHIFKDIRV